MFLTPYRLILLVTLYFLSPWSHADDTEIYDGLLTCVAQNQEKYRFVFIVDNSGSMSSWEFAQSRNTVNQTITEVLGSKLEDVQVAVVQYGTNHFTKEHKYNVTVPFTADLSIATDWNRHYGPGTDNVWDLQDHQPASLARMRRENVYSAGGALDVSDATNVQFVFFTDALRDYYQGCCSSLVATDSPNHNLLETLPGFGEYDGLKNGTVLPNGLKAQFTILHVPPGGSYYAPASRAAAAIASPGGSYTGDVERNDNDPGGPGSKPRRYVQGTFGVDDASKILELIQQVIVEVQDTTYTNVAPAVSVNAFNELQHRDEIYFSVFQPSLLPRWGGNVKKFRINDEGVLLDATGSPAIDPATGSISKNSRSIWSESIDGNVVELGGYRGKLTNTRTVYTDPAAISSQGIDQGTELIALTPASEVSYSLLGLGRQDDDNQCVPAGDKATGFITVTSDGADAVSSVVTTGGRDVVLEFLASADVVAEIRHYKDTDESFTATSCAGKYAGGTSLHSCTAKLAKDIVRVDVHFISIENTSTIEYSFEYNIPDNGEKTACGTLEAERSALLSWITGIDIYNSDKDELKTDSHQFAADPLHSQPVVVTYSGTSEDDSVEVLFFTDNLGMLHAIDPDDSKGDVLWSYLPNEHLDNIKRYAVNKAGDSKYYGIDGFMSVIQRKADASARNDFRLKEVNLLLGERRGGRTYYSLDVTEAPLPGRKPAVNWKISGGADTRFSDLGQTWSELLPRKLKVDCVSPGVGCSVLEVLVFSGGYDPVYDNSKLFPTGTVGNAIYIVDVATGGEKFFWSAGNNNDEADEYVHKLDLSIAYSVVATPTTIDTDGDGAIDLIYAVDISGSVWRMDIDSTQSAASKNLIKGGKIAQLSDPVENRRFYNKLDISRSDPRSGKDRYYIVAGSGYRAHPNEVSTRSDRLYLLFDPYTSSRYLTTEKEELHRYHYINGERTVGPLDLFEYRDNQRASGSGYYMVLGGRGEKILQPSVTFNSTIIVSSFIPAENDGETCTIGSGRTYFLNLDNLKSVFSNDYIELARDGIPPTATLLHLPRVSVCIGTECATSSRPPLETTDNTETDEDPCDPKSFSIDNYSGELVSAVSATVCGLYKGRAYRAQWLEHGG